MDARLAVAIEAEEGLVVARLPACPTSQDDRRLRGARAREIQSGILDGFAGSHYCELGEAVQQRELLRVEVTSRIVITDLGSDPNVQRLGRQRP